MSINIIEDRLFNLGRWPVSSNPQPLRDPSAVLVLLYRNRVHIDPCRRQISMAKRFLCFRQTACVLGDHSRERVPRLMDVDGLQTRLGRIFFQILGKTTQTS